MGHEILPDGSIRHYGRIEPGDPPRNPTGKGGFGDHPEHRSNGRWRPETSPGYVLNRLARLTAEELEAETEREDLTAVERLAIRQIQEALGEDLDPLQRLKLVEALWDRTEGKPVARVDATVDPIPPPVINLTVADVANRDDGR